MVRRLFLYVSFFCVVWGSPLTLAERQNRDYGVKNKTSIKVSQSQKELLRAGNLYNNYSINGGTNTLVTLTHNFVYSPRSDVDLIVAGDGSYQSDKKTGILVEEEKESLKLNSFWIGANYVSPFFEFLSPTLNARMGSLDNADSSFIAGSLRTKFAHRFRVNVTWERHFYRLNPKSGGWRDDANVYSISTTSAEFSYALHPRMETSLLVVDKGRGGGIEASKRVLVSLKSFF
ncbi:hypothetical protein CCZ01_00255 [Helicobacter monodelphidis]|uniref:hypothetical protein n=1 Tax=Helicobacter sp. 15-1451 TaxID=2004995 RepID=UPI000DCD853A|nr:hypothetical protein [Helicobacter sp. 15-1451]RAX59212.1 hypothetical protein CCZ01_00255 [Helicobacter sp. 15-1451]